jgi:hypothetical protein
MAGDSTSSIGALAGATLLVAGITGGGVTLAGSEVPVVTEWTVQALLILIGTALLAFNTQWPIAVVGVLAVASLGVILLPAVLSGSPDPDETTEPIEPSQEPSEDPGPGSSTKPVPEPTGCTVEISNPLASIHEAPENFSQEVGSVPPGSYAVLDVAVVPWAGQDERWLQVEAGGQRGWLKDNSFNIDHRSRACQF